jgi:hypothetical protein
MMQAMMMANTTIKVVFVMPGAVTDAQGGTVDGRTVTFIIQGKELQEAKGDKAEKVFTVKCAAPDAAAQAEFAKIVEQINQAEVEENAADEGDDIK